MKPFVMPRCFGPPWTLFVLAIHAAACAPDGTTAPAKQRDEIEVVWRTPVTASGAGREDLAIDDHAFYTLVNGLTAYDLNTGAPLWNVPESRYRALNLVVSGGRLFVASTDVQAIDARTGAALWRAGVDSLARMETTADDRAVYVGTDTRRVVALDVVTGRPLWSAEVLADGAYRESVVGIVAHGDTVYAAIVQELNQSGGAKRGWMVALDRNTGRVLWRYVNERLDEPHDVGGHAVAGRMLLLNDLNGGAMIGLDRFTGQEVWRKTGPRDRRGAWDSFKVVDGVGYVASNDTHLYSLDPESGRIIWQTGIGASASSSAVCGDKVFTDAYGLHMVRRSDGQVLATLFLDENGSVGSSYVISRLQARGGRVYFVGNDAVYAVTCN